MLLSIISPVYKAEGIVSELVRRIKDSVEPINTDFEIILVEDGSPDNSWNEMVIESGNDPRVKAVKLSRNFGQHYAITAGLDLTKGDWVVVMDCDLQDRPEEIPNLFKEAKQGYDIVLARRIERTDGFLKKISSKLFYRVLSYLTGVKQDPAIANFGIYNRSVILAIKEMREPIRYLPTMVRWVGFKKGFISIQHGNRYAGSTSYNWKKMFRLATDIILANSDKPIRIIVKIGMIISVVSFFVGLITLWRYLNHDILVAGYTSLLISVWFLGGITIMVLGVIGLYVGKIFEGVKSRPPYIIQSSINLQS